MHKGESVLVGERIKAMRESLGLSLKAVEERSGISSAILNQIENHMESPSLGVLGKIASALGVRIGDIWGDKGQAHFALTRCGEEALASRFASKEGVTYGYGYSSLGFGMKDRHMEPYIVDLEPPTVKAPEPSSHEGEEFLYVTKGEVLVYLNGHTDLLKVGDSIQYDSRLPHRVSNNGKEPAQIVAVLWSPEKK